MARMIPMVLDSECQSRGEADLFVRLREDPETRDWIVLHSLDLARHGVKISGELDFVVIIPGRGVLCLEVKACRRLHRDDRGWFYGSDPIPDPRGPFKQAAQGMHALRASIREQRPDLASGMVYWSAAAFPFVDFALNSPEWHPWQFIDAHAYRTRPISYLLSNILDRAREYLAAHPTAAPWFRPASHAPYPGQCEELAELLRPQFEVFENPRSRRAHLSEELKRYTVEQFAALRAMERNPRVAFHGPAGTGKTLLAIEAVRRASDSGRRVLMLCFNRFLGTHLRQEMLPLEARVTVGTLHGFMLQLAGRRADGMPLTEELWQRTLPDLALEALIEDSEGTRLYDELVIDEGQDLLKPAYLDILDQSLRGGLAAGRWRLFGDWENQAVYSDNPESGEASGVPSGTRNTADLSLEEFCEHRGGGAPIYDLRTNCRNTPRIASWAETLGDMVPGYERVLRPDDQVEPEIHSYTTPQEELDLLEKALEQLERENYKGRDIVILSARTGDACATTRLGAPWKGRIRPFRPDSRDGSISYCTIHAFKGLEAPAIIVTDIDERTTNQVALLFVAATRALNRLVILPHRSVHEEVARRILGTDVGSRNSASTLAS